MNNVKNLLVNIQQVRNSYQNLSEMGHCTVYIKNTLPLVNHFKSDFEDKSNKN